MLNLLDLEDIISNKPSKIPSIIFDNVDNSSWVLCRYILKYLPEYKQRALNFIECNCDNVSSQKVLFQTLYDNDITCIVKHISIATFVELKCDIAFQHYNSKNPHTLDQTIRMSKLGENDIRYFLDLMNCAKHNSDNISSVYKCMNIKPGTIQPTFAISTMLYNLEYKMNGIGVAWRTYRAFNYIDLNGKVPSGRDYFNLGGFQIVDGHPTMLSNYTYHELVNVIKTLPLCAAGLILRDLDYENDYEKIKEGIRSWILNFDEKFLVRSKLIREYIPTDIIEDIMRNESIIMQRLISLSILD
ncbi:hypothetical protein D3C87_1135110 [compost metagenome]